MNANPISVAFVALADRLNNRVRSRLKERARGKLGIAHLAEMNAMVGLSDDLIAVAHAIAINSSGPRDSDGSGEAGETRSGSTVGDSAGRNGIAKGASA